MDRGFKWGIIGTGRIAHTFAQALAGTENAVLHAAASRTLARAERFAEQYGFEKAYGSYHELAEDTELDAVYIATPMASHYSDAMLCIKNGRNVLCEKSVTLNAMQLRELLKAAAEQGVFFMEAMWMKCRPAYLKAKEWFADNRIGELRYIKADFMNLVQYDPEDRLFRADCGGGALLDLAVYPLTLAQDFMGAVGSIESAAHIGTDGVDLSNSIMLRSSDGKAFASCDSGFELPSRNNAVISGTAGSIIFGDWFLCSCEVTLLDRQGREVEKVCIPNEVNGYEYEVREVQHCLAAGLRESMLVPHSATLSVMEIMDECRRQWGMRFPGE